MRIAAGEDKSVQALGSKGGVTRKGQDGGDFRNRHELVGVRGNDGRGPAGQKARALQNEQGFPIIDLRVGFG